LLNKLNELPIKNFIDQAVQDNDTIIEDYQAEQMFEGKRADGTDIEPGYKEITKMIKRAKGQPVNRVTLKDEGDFHRGIKIEKVGDGFEMDSTDFKTSKLVRKYGVNIFGFDQQRLELVKEVISNDVKKAVYEYFVR